MELNSTVNMLSWWHGSDKGKEGQLLLCCICVPAVQVTADIDGKATPVAVNEKGIAWDTDIKHKFGSQSAENFNTQENAAYRGGDTITGTEAPSHSTTD